MEQPSNDKEVEAIQQLEEYLSDPWPLKDNGEKQSGQDLVKLIGSGANPFAPFWDMNQLLTDIQHALTLQSVQLLDISKGSNNYVRRVSEQQLN